MMLPFLAFTVHMWSSTDDATLVTIGDIAIEIESSRTGYTHVQESSSLIVPTSSTSRFSLLLFLETVTVNVTWLEPATESTVTKALVKSRFLTTESTTQLLAP